MRSIDIRGALERILPRVTRPARYTGGEWGMIYKDTSKPPFRPTEQAREGSSASADSAERGGVRIALAFPDVYEIGMSNLGLRILYHILNSRSDIFAERVFAPWPDMEHEMRRAGLPLCTLETFTPLGEMDIVGFSLAYEMTFTNVLNMLDLAGIPVLSSERGDDDPLVIAGGHCAFNPEPMAPFIDAFVIGEGEEAVLEVVEAFRMTSPARGLPGFREALLLELLRIPGVYVPAFYKARYGDDGSFVRLESTRDDAPWVIRKRLVDDFENAPYPDKLIVPFLETVHDRAAVEIMRGCGRGCRFCQAGMITRPVRKRSPETLRRQAKALLDSTGYDEIALTSLSSADYVGIDSLVHELIDEYEPYKVGISLPSLRADAECVNLAADIERVRKTGLTFAPEAGTQRLRDAINKNITMEALLSAVEAAVSHGWRKIKLYFMIGLPTETDEDVLGIAEAVKSVLKRSKERGHTVAVNVTASVFVPKPHTPFQWRRQESLEEIERKFGLLKDALRIKSVSLSWHDPKTSRIEAVLARGDRRVGDAIYRAWKLGARFDGWDEHFSYERWLKAFEAAGVDPDYYANRRWDYDQPLPWDHIDSGVTKRYLAGQDRLADGAKPSPDCHLGKCTNCGIKSMLPPGIQNCSDLGETKSEPTVRSMDEQLAVGAPRPAGPAGYSSSDKRFRILFAFSKGEEVRWLGHLDILRTFERAVRRAGLPLSFSEGFNPRPRMSFASALGVGVTGDRELMSLELSQPVEPTEAARALNESLPQGIRIVEARPIDASRQKSMQVVASEFEVAVGGAGVQELRYATRDLLNRREVVALREKDGSLRAINIRQGIRSLEVDLKGSPIIRMRLEHGPVTPKPAEVIAALGESLARLEILRIHRRGLIMRDLDCEEAQPLSDGRSPGSEVEGATAGHGQKGGE